LMRRLWRGASKRPEIAHDSPCGGCFAPQSK
jgi:hypothetical protein